MSTPLRSISNRPPPIYLKRYKSEMQKLRILMRCYIKLRCSMKLFELPRMMWHGYVNYASDDNRYDYFISAVFVMTRKRIYAAYEELSGERHVAVSTFDENTDYDIHSRYDIHNMSSVAVCADNVMYFLRKRDDEFIAKLEKQLRKRGAVSLEESRERFLELIGEDGIKALTDVILNEALGGEKREE